MVGKKGAASYVMGPLENNSNPQSFGQLGLEKYISLLQIFCGKGFLPFNFHFQSLDRCNSEKYLAPRSILEWIQDPEKCQTWVSIMWKVALQSFDLIGNWIGVESGQWKECENQVGSLTRKQARTSSSFGD